MMHRYTHDENIFPKIKHIYLRCIYNPPEHDYTSRLLLLQCKRIVSSAWVAGFQLSDHINRLIATNDYYALVWYNTLPAWHTCLMVSYSNFESSNAAYTSLQCKQYTQTLGRANRKHYTIICLAHSINAHDTVLLPHCSRKYLYNTVLSI